MTTSYQTLLFRYSTHTLQRARSMNIEGTYTLQAPPTEVWHCLLNTELLQHTIPGIERIEQVSENTYTIVANIKHAPLEGTYQGHITLSEQHYPYHYRLIVEGEGQH